MVPSVVMLSVEVPDPVTEVGLNVPAAPAGNPVTLSETAPLKPFTAVTVCVYEVPAPCTTACEPGDEARVKSGTGTAFTNSAEVALCVSAPLVPVIVSVFVPVGVVASVVTDSVDVPEPVMEGGLNVPVASAGKPVTPSETAPLKPFTAVTVCVYVVPAPCTNDCVDGEEVMLKSGVTVALTMSVIVVVWVSVPLAPVIVSVYVPVGVVAAVETVSAEVPDPVMLDGLKDAVAAVGNPLTLSATAPLNPFAAATAGEYSALPPCATLCDPGAAPNAKSAEGDVPP